VNNFLEIFLFDPIPLLLESGDKTLIYFAQWDLLGEVTGLRYFEE
jgi:hypothetical protein